MTPEDQRLVDQAKAHMTNIPPSDAHWPEKPVPQLPAGMEHCTILFIECPVGHGRLTAANWVDHGCPWCEIDRLKGNPPGMLDELRLMNLIRRTRGAMVASCKCMTKTPDPAFHKPECLYRILNDAEDVLLKLYSSRIPVVLNQAARKVYVSVPAGQADLDKEGLPLGYREGIPADAVVLAPSPGWDANGSPVCEEPWSL